MIVVLQVMQISAVWGLFGVLCLFVGVAVGRRWRLPLRVIVTDRRGDYQAWVEGDPGRWGCGPTGQAAIGEMVSGHPERFGVEVEWRIGPEAQEIGAE